MNFNIGKDLNDVVNTEEEIQKMVSNRCSTKASLIESRYTDEQSKPHDCMVGLSKLSSYEKMW